VVVRGIGRGTAYVGAAKAIGGAAIAATNVWIARHLEPSVYGAFAFAATCVLLVDGVLGASFDAAVLRYASDNPDLDGRVTAIESVAALIKAGVAAAAIAAVVLVRAPLARLLLHDASASWILVLAAIAGGGVLLIRSVQAYFQIRRRFAAYGVVDLVNTFVRTAFILTALAAGVRAAGPLVAAYVIAPTVILISLAGPALRLMSAGVWTDRAAWRAAVGFSAVAAATCSVGAIVARLDVIILAIASSPADVGLFGLASMAALMPALLGAYIAPALTPNIVPLARRGAFLPFFARIQTALIALAVVIVAASVMVLPSAVAWGLPVSYRPVTRVVEVMILSGVAGLVTFPMTLHFLLFFRPRFYVLMDLASLPLLIPAYSWAARHHGALGVAWVTAASNVIKAAIAQAAAVRLARALTPAGVVAATQLSAASAA
jgi:O-antigen/teichoic acid export membrane protein